ncbi:MAG: GNAT family protein [Desulfobacteraceae bacterium]|jgi:RimJ/RimL family protein N-acetyltransferase|nr:GNAT family protein [Desulfobacteraceae bacterium]
MDKNSRKYDVFIHGETIDLVIPNENAIDEDGWHNWFNDPLTTKYLHNLGQFPVSKEQQKRRLQKMSEDSQDALSLLILPKGTEKVIGITHIKGIDWKLRSGHCGLIISSRDRSFNIYHGLESKARMVEHAFDVLGLERVWGAQVVDLEVWQRYQVLFGFRPEGITRRTFKKGQKYYDEVITSCLVEDYLKIKEERDGQYWPGKANMMKLLRTVPKESLVDKVSLAIQSSMVDYMKNIKMS